MDKYFNSDLKNVYIAERHEEISVSSHHFDTLFKFTGKFEKKYGKDVSNFNYYEISDMYKSSNKQPETLFVINSHLSNYTNWCINKNLVDDNQNHFLEMNSHKIILCTNKMAITNRILSEEEINEIVNKCENYRDKYVLLALYEGIRGESYCEIGRLKLSDIEGNVAHLCTGRDLVISDKLKTIIEEAYAEDSYKTLNETSKVIRYSPDAEDYVYKLLRGGDRKNTDNMIYQQATRVLKSFDMYDYISVNDIYTSGRIRYVANILKERPSNVSALDFLKTKIDDIRKVYDTPIVALTFLRKYQTIFELKDSEIM